MRRHIMIASLLVSAAVQADEEELGWSGKGEFGLVSARGNTETETVNFGLHFVNNLEHWRHSFDLSALKSSERDVDTAERIELRAKTDYKMTEISYAFASLRYLNDEFSEYESQATVAVGYGRELFDNDVHDLEGEVGVGFRRSEIRLLGETDSEAIVRAALKYRWTISETSSLTNDLLIEAGADNTFGQNVTALNTRINGALGLQVAYDVRHNTDVTEPVNNTDTLTTVSLVYGFE